MKNKKKPTILKVQIRWSCLFVCFFNAKLLRTIEGRCQIENVVCLNSFKKKMQGVPKLETLIRHGQGEP